MVPVHQTKFRGSDRFGNCLAAALASLFEIPLAAVPQFEEMFGDGNPAVWQKQYHNFLTGQGVRREVRTVDPKLDDYYFAQGKSPRAVDGEAFDHCVIYKAGRLVHDPYPGGVGIPEVSEFIVFVPID